MTQRQFNFWELILTRALPVVVSLVVGYLLLFADSRYVKKSDYDARMEKFQKIVTDVEVIKNNSQYMTAQLNRIEDRLEH